MNRGVPSYIAMPNRAFDAGGVDMRWSIVDDVLVFDPVDLGHNTITNDVIDDDVLVFDDSLDFIGHGYNNNNVENYNDGTTRVVGVNKPASQDSIKNLERVTIDHGGKEESSECSICLGVLSVGSIAIRMPHPCSHVYHQDCITRWLNICNTCPLCRRSIHS